ncbi:MAG: hypothetical protein KR126chlam3_01429 [Chlamydiae bacterium]|nr:hypothetical protein [Chlamydiota bacterium]
MAAVTGTESYTLDAFNKVLKERIDFIDAEGKVIKASFWSALKHSPLFAQKLVERIDARVKHFAGADDKSEIDTELRQFQEERDYFLAVVGQAREIFHKFGEMQNSLDESSIILNAAVITVKEDIPEVMERINTLANRLEVDYLKWKTLEGTRYVWNKGPSIDGRLEKLRKLLPQEKV